jgi:hypothetical protein
MKLDDIIKIARQTGDATKDARGRESFEFDSYGLKAFAKLVAAKEREACAKVCEEHGKVWAERMLLGFQATLDDAAKAIRARSSSRGEAV